MNQDSIPGHDRAETSRELSIQITRSGFSFSVSQNWHFLYGSQAQSYDFEAIIGNVDRFSSIYVGWSSDAVMMMPDSVFGPTFARDYLRAANMLDPTLVAHYNQGLNPLMTALWAVDVDLISLIEGLMPGAYHYHNLQLDLLNAKPESIRISVIQNTANVVIFTREGLYAAETINFDTPQDLLFFVSKLNSVDKFSRHPLEFIADDAEIYRPLFEPQFPQSTFVTNNNIYHQIILKCE